jgi:hypothetical protein
VFEPRKIVGAARKTGDELEDELRSSPSLA